MPDASQESWPPIQPEDAMPPTLHDYRDEAPETSVSGVFVFTDGSRELATGTSEEVISAWTAR
jgi:hypothetical protein